MPRKDPDTSGSDTLSHSLRLRHARTGWYLLAVFAAMGLLLESLHGLKLQAYVGVDNSIRRELWTLAHAHGTLLAIVHLAFASTITHLQGDDSNKLQQIASKMLTLSSLGIPIGFFLGGLHFYEGDPGLGIVLVPIGAICLVTASLLIASNLGNHYWADQDHVVRKDIASKRK